ncbi:hypothetical protein [Nocardia sp. alder85J]|uniref:hypothetical protein n=1 Tax=Nocardia sp. alder85J TaxID=2862949 RepID=UPI001CD47556|nr:hypothetical protein [Nocardia sp. alder85J]MCX4096222.1 hypothetical protein [Nocardia sp. alder85J]
MTPPDDEPEGDESAEEAANPFDLGLPMVRMPSRRPRRRRGTRKLARRNRTPGVDTVDPDRVTPADILRTHDVDHRPGSVSIRRHDGGWDDIEPSAYGPHETTAVHPPVAPENGGVALPDESRGFGPGYSAGHPAAIAYRQPAEEPAPGYGDAEPVAGESVTGSGYGGHLAASGYADGGVEPGHPESGGPADDYYAAGPTPRGYSARHSEDEYPSAAAASGYPVTESASYPVTESSDERVAQGYSQPESGDAAGWPESQRGSSDERSGGWEQWLDSSSPRAEPQQLTSHVQIRGYEGDDDYEEERVTAPSLVDRSGGNPGLRLRHPRRAGGGSERGSGNRPMALLIMLGLGIVVVAVLLVALHSAQRRTPSQAASPASTRVPVAAGSAVPSTAAAPAGAIAAEGCEQKRGSDVMSGTDPGGTGSGPDAIFAFERAYYVQRSGFAARAVVADDATVPPADQIQRGIDQVPSGTRYCVQITRAGIASDTDGQWEVRLTQQKPGESPRTFTQIVGTRTAGARTLITTIAGA